MKRKFASQRLHASFPEIRKAQSVARFAITKKLVLVVAGVVAVGILGSLLIHLKDPSHENLPIETPSAQSELEVLRQTLEQFDQLRNQAIEYRDIGLIHEYAEALSPVFMADSELIRSLIDSDIQISDVEYDIEKVEILSLRRSGNSEFVRLLVQDSRTEYQQSINDVISVIPARKSSRWNVELFRNSKNDEWTLWSIAEVIKPLQQ